MSFLAIDAALPAPPTGWRRIGFKRAFGRLEDRAGTEAVDRLSLSSLGYLYPREGTADRQQASAETAARSLRVAPGQLVVNPMWLTGGSIAVSHVSGAVSPDYRVFQPSAAIHPRFAHHLLRSQPYRDQYDLFIRANTTFDRRVQQDDIDAMPLMLPALGEQRRIADFLDDRVARIDRIIAARREQLMMNIEAMDSQWDALARGLAKSHGEVPVRRFLVSIADGPFGSSLTSKHYSDSGTRVIRLGNIGIGAFRPDDHAYVPNEYAASLVAHAVNAGDLVMAGLGDERWPLGRCAIVPADLGPAIVKADCYRIRLDRRITHSFAAAYFSSPVGRPTFGLLARGSTRARLNTEVAREALIPPAPLLEQSAFVDTVEQMLTARAEQEAQFNRSVGLLTEYKSSLITATVTGELDVTTAWGGITS